MDNDNIIIVGEIILCLLPLAVILVVAMRLGTGR